MKISIQSLPFITKLKPVWRYRVVFFVTLVAGLCGYLLIEINTALNVAPKSDASVAAVRKAPRIDPAVVQQLESLQDNSVTVQALFNEARENPFQ